MNMVCASGGLEGGGVSRLGMKGTLHLLLSPPLQSATNATCISSPHGWATPVEKVKQVPVPRRLPSKNCLNSQQHVNTIDRLLKMQDLTDAIFLPVAFHSCES